MKRIICFFVWVALSISPAFAYTPSELEAANFLASEWIIVNHADNPSAYELDKDIQRQAIMKVVMKLSWRSVPDTCRGEFSDVNTQDWPCKYIEAALDAGFIAHNDTFRPYDNITKTEAMKLVLKSRWIQKTQETSSWQEDYMETAYHYGIIDQKYYDYNAYATRGWIFQIATATIEKQDEIEAEGWVVSDEFEMPDDMIDDELDAFLEEILSE